MEQPYSIRSALTDRSLYLDTLKLGIPIAGQSLIAVGMNVADTVMLGKMGDAQISAASMAGQYVTLFLACVMGLGMGVTVLTNRYWSMGKPSDLHRSVTVMLRWELLLAGVFAVIGVVFPRFVMGIFTKDAETIAYGMTYLRWLLPCYGCIALSQGCTLVLRSAGKLLVPLAGAAGALGLNVLLNFLLIEGNWGAPRLEITGAAIATSAAWVFQFLTTCGYFFFAEGDIGYRLRELREDCREIMPEYLRISLPVLISDGLLGLGSSVISMVMGHMGPIFAAANSVTVVVIQLSTVLHFGVSGAAGVITGHTMGRGELRKAEARGYAFVVIALGVGLAAALGIVVLREPVLEYYHVSGEAKLLARKLMQVIPVFVVVQSVNGVLTKGVLRVGGDTRFLMVADILFLWTVSIPLGLLGAFKLGWPAVVVYEVMKVDLLLKCGWCLWRLRSGRWQKNL